ncbi:MAG: M66 family metalloprotease [Gammaproteobacteria bacterium]|nr:M66 family metalloprotease [Gammaproteobacteria bacterium]
MVPPELGSLSNLRQLHIGNGNDLKGPIPPELGNLSNLTVLIVGYANLTGPVPPELGSLANLWYLDLSGNGLTGTVPLIFRQLTRLQVFTFDENAGLCLPHGLVEWYEGIESRRGQVCPDREVLSELYEATGGEGWTNAEGWLEDGPLGDWYGVEVDSAGLVSTLDLQGNGLSGSLPARLGDLASLTTLRIGDNALSGPLPTSLSRTPLQELRYANTDLCVPDAAWFPRFRDWLAALPQHEGTGAQCPALTDREILAALYHATGGANWENGDNWVTDAPLSEWHGVGTNAEGRVTRLDLRWNGLQGSIPAALGGLAELEILILFANDLAGPIPPALGSLAKVELVVLAGNRLSGPIPPEMGGLASVEELWLNGNELTSVPPELGELANLLALSLSFNELTSIPPELGALPALEFLGLNFNQLMSVPPELGGLAQLVVLGLWSNELTSVPPELGELGNLVELDLDENRLTSIPGALGRLDNLFVLFLRGNRLTSLPSGIGGMTSLAFLDLSANEFTSLPPELAELGNLRALALEESRLTSVPPGLGGMASLELLDLSSNEFTSFPRELAELGNLTQLELDGNRLADIPTGLGGGVGAERLASSASERPPTLRRLSAGRRARGRSDEPWRLGSDGKLETWDTSRTHEGRDRSRSTDVRPRVGGLAGLEILDLSSNEFSGPLPAGLLALTGLTSLGLADNAGLTGALPLDLAALERLEDLHTIGTELCAPTDPEFLDWLEGVTRQRVALCAGSGDAGAYLTQVVQSRAFPVPLIAGKPALLRVFVTAERASGAALPPVHATFYRDGAVTYELDIPAKPDPIPTEVDESSLSKSVNAEIPGWVVQPGLEVVIEPDPNGTLDPALGVATRIPATGRMAVDVRTMPVFELTLVPFIWEEDPDHSIVEITAGMAADPEGHELFERTHVLLPVTELNVTAHPAVTSPTNNGVAIMELTDMIRVAEGGRGHYLGVMAGPTSPGGLLGIAFDIGSWSSFSVLDAETIAHELGHNRNLYHAPACGAGGPDRYYPYGDGNIGAWGWDVSTGELVAPDRWDFMSYCEPTWVSDYQYANAIRYRIETESNSILVAAADGRGASSSQTLLVWGGLDGEGEPHLRPAFFTDAPPALPSADGPWSLTGRDSGGAVIFSVSFAMSEFTDTEGDHAGFTFALPVTWTGELASIALQGPGGSASLDRDTDDPLTILRDAATGRIRGILGGPPPPAPAPSPGVPAAADEGFEILFSRGIPSTPGGRD